MPSQSAATLRSRYAGQAASDLEENRRLQRDLAEKIEMLKREEELLVDILNLSQRFPEPADAQPLPVQAPEEPALPQVRKPAEATGSADSSTPSPRTPTGSGRSNAGKSVAKKRSNQPLLGDLLAELLGEHEKPRLAKDLRDELLAKHPEREPTPQVVRNTLESLVAKGRVRRHKQNRTVMYTIKNTAR
ncbi:hypothetical protein AB0I54_44365 [Streptomyces sp. NPDC050625]|uniref:hypothetical protein n=1 Tax=Streptomyces sp. NPDC050625 TaxID=3154629 RepID=UPI003442D04D